jgi:uncharacterized protein (TIGR02246 family)
MDALAVVETFGEAWASHDLERTLSLITDDCVFDATGPAPDGIRSVGRAAIRDAWAPIFEDASSLFEVESTFVLGDHVVQQWRYSWGDGHVRGIDLFRVEGNLVAEKHSYVKG